jgi:DNA polymerase III subunit epsilon
MAFAQRAEEEPGTPLAQVCFCVVDLETTGGSPRSCAVTEIGAIRVRRGEVVGSFQTLIDPGEPVPAFVRLLTGITNEMLIDAPSIVAVLPSFLEFLGSSVIVAHNARFDLSFLDAALCANGYEPLKNRVIDTALLARKMLAGEVPNHKLQTLATYLRCAHRPRHRAFADVLATTDVLHHLIERAAGFGVTTLEDLVAMTATRIDGTFAKIELCRELPRGPGVYRFLGSSGQTLYVGKATDIRSRVRSYFYGDPRRRMRDLLKETQRIEAELHPSTLEAEVAEVRAIANELPPYNRAGKRRAAWYVKIDHHARVPRVCPVRTPKEDRAVYLGPVSSLKVARLLMESFRDALRLHRCTDPARCKGCAFSQMGTCPGGDIDLHREAIRRLAIAVGYDPDILLAPLRDRMRALARHERFEEAAEVRTRASLLESVLRARAETQALLDARAIAITDGRRAWLIENGQLAAAADASGARSLVAASRARMDFFPVGSFWPPGSYREARVVSAWIRRNASRLRLVHAEGSWILPAGAGGVEWSPTYRYGGRPQVIRRA